MGHESHFTEIWKAEMKWPYPLWGQKGDAACSTWQLTHAVADWRPHFVRQWSSLLLAPSAPTHTHITAVGGLDAGRQQRGFQRIFLCSPVSLSPPFHICLPFPIFFYLMTWRPTSDIEATALQKLYCQSSLRKPIFLSFLRFYFFDQTHVFTIHMCILSIERAYC